MHIPDGYLSPETAAVMYAVSLPFWYRATRKIKTLLTGRSVPLIALFAALSFVVMMFNVPLPGGTTGHAVGSVLAAIVLGPWAASLAVSVALVIQAFFFGDGGILAIGANAFNMAIAMPMVGYAIYRWLAGTAPLEARRRVIAGAIAGYVAINVGALLTGIELGLQPMLFRDAAGHALYFPYPLQVSVPAMMLGHLTIAGGVEAFVTGLVIAWLQRTNPQLLELTGGGKAAAAAGTRIPRWAWLALLALVLLTPIGLLAPGTAWGEWSREQLQQLGLGYIPSGFDRWSSLWSAPLAGYGHELLDPAVGYIISALLGVVVVFGATFALAWLLGRTVGNSGAASPGARPGSDRPSAGPAEQRGVADRTEQRGAIDRAAPSTAPRALRGAPLGTPGSAQDAEERVASRETLWSAKAQGKAGKPPTRGFFEKTISSFTDTLEQTLFAEEIARQDGWLQSLDPRVKLIGTLVLLVAASLSHNLVVIAALYLLTLPVAWASRVPMGFYLKRVWVFMPFFTGIVALPALFSPFSPGAPFLTLVDLASPHLYLAITWPGLVTAAFLLLRVATSVSLAVLLVLTTRWAVLLKSLRVLRMPQAFVLILGMTYRYIYVLLHAANNMFLARRSRLVGHVSPAEERHWLAASMGTLIAKSYALSDDVYLAMQSRGFRGEAQIMETLQWRARDWAWLALFIAVAVGSWVIR